MITTKQAIMERHSVRVYKEDIIEPSVREQLDAEALLCSQESGLTFRIVYDDEKGFDSALAHYGRFRNVRNYILIASKGGRDVDEKSGYYGERLVILAQQLGLNTCWAALTHGKSKAAHPSGEAEIILIALGYGQTQGNARKSKRPSEVSNLSTDSPEWFRKGVEAALLAPTAINQQKFRFILLDGRKVSASTGRFGPCLSIDLGIAKCHFELGAGKENFEWA